MTSNYFFWNVRRPTEIHITPSKVVTCADALKCCLELLVADYEALTAQCSA